MTRREVFQAFEYELYSLLPKDKRNSIKIAFYPHANETDYHGAKPFGVIYRNKCDWYNTLGEFLDTLEGKE